MAQRAKQRAQQWTGKFSKWSFQATSRTTIKIVSSVDKEPPRVSLRGLSEIVSTTDKELPRVSHQDPNTAASAVDKGTYKMEDSTTHKDRKELERQLQIYKKQLRGSSQVSKWRPF